MVPFTFRLPRVRLVVAGLVAFLVAGHMLVTVAAHSSMDLFNLNEEGTLGTWFSAGFLGVVGLGCLVLTPVPVRRRRTRGGRRAPARHRCQG